MNGTQAGGEGLVGRLELRGWHDDGFAVDGAEHATSSRSAAYLQQKLAWRDRLFFTAAVRGDDNSAFGQDFKLVTYPSASLSWVIGDESWFPQIRRRQLAAPARVVRPVGAAPGLPQRGRRSIRPSASGARPAMPAASSSARTSATRAQARALDASTRAASTSGSSTAGCRSSCTYYNKSTRDALIQRQLAPSTGAQTQFENLGEVDEQGLSRGR